MLRDLIKVASEKDISAKIEKGGLRVDGKYYGPNRFTQLPDDIKPQSIRTKQTVNGGLAFASEWTPLSNMYPCKFVYQDMLFESSEQCFQYQKAIHDEEDLLASEIFALSNAYDCKKSGDSFTPSPGWNDACEDEMKRILRAKFEQNKDIRHFLLNTKDATLYKATKGDYWGIDLALNSKEAHEEAGTGKNRLGLILMALRSEMIAQYPDELDLPSEHSQSSESSDAESVEEDEEGSDPAAIPAPPT